MPYQSSAEEWLDMLLLCNDPWSKTVIGNEWDECVRCHAGQILDQLWCTFSIVRCWKYDCFQHNLTHHAHSYCCYHSYYELGRRNWDRFVIVRHLGWILLAVKLMLIFIWSLPFCSKLLFWTLNGELRDVTDDLWLQCKEINLTDWKIIILRRNSLNWGNSLLQEQSIYLDSSPCVSHWRCVFSFCANKQPSQNQQQLFWASALGVQRDVTLILGPWRRQAESFGPMISLGLGRDRNADSWNFKGSGSFGLKSSLIHPQTGSLKHCFLSFTGNEATLV